MKKPSSGLITLIVLIAFVEVEEPRRPNQHPQFHALIMKDGKIYKDTMNKRGE